MGTVVVPTLNVGEAQETRVPKLTQPTDVQQYRDEVEVISRRLYEISPNCAKDPRYCDVHLSLVLSNGILASLCSNLAYAGDCQRDTDDLFSEQVDGLQQVLISTLQTARRRVNLPPRQW